MFKKYLIRKLTELSAWLGVLIMVAALLFPRSIILFLGFILVVTSDNVLKDLFSQWSPSIRKILEEAKRQS